MSIGFWRAQKSFQSGFEAIDVLQITLPNVVDSPPCHLESGAFFRVSLTVSGNFRFPKLEIRFWKPSNPASVSMPKAAVNKYCLAPQRENYVGLSGKVSAMQAKTITEAVQN
jgi:hypothetical protein